MRLLISMMVAALFVGNLSLWAGDLSPAGRWTAFDEDTGGPDAIIEIERREDGTLYGWIAEILTDQHGGDTARCTECEGELKDAPILGMTIIRGMRHEDDAWHGTIMDPKNGTVYNATMSLAQNGEKLDVRGYIGIPLFGRSQVWERTE